jgi:hypothetical protein
LVAGLALWAVFYPTDKTASLEFRVDFDGIQDGKYPNGTKFSVEDILSEPVVRRVFDENGLQKYEKYEKFRTSLVVTSINRDLDILELEYRTRLRFQRDNHASNGCEGDRVLQGSSGLVQGGGEVWNRRGLPIGRPEGHRGPFRVGLGRAGEEPR